jgi:hypothetical protein
VGHHPSRPGKCTTLSVLLLFGFFLLWLSLTGGPFYAASLLSTVALEGGVVGHIAGGGEAAGRSGPLEGDRPRALHPLSKVEHLESEVTRLHSGHNKARGDAKRLNGERTRLQQDLHEANSWVEEAESTLWVVNAHLQKANFNLQREWAFGRAFIGPWCLKGK